MEIALGQATYRVTVSPFEMGDLLVLRPLPQPRREKAPFFQRGLSDAGVPV